MPSASVVPVLQEHERISGSRAQRDLVEFTLMRACVEAGRYGDLRRMLGEGIREARTVPVPGLTEFH